MWKATCSYEWRENVNHLTRRRRRRKKKKKCVTMGWPRPANVWNQSINRCVRHRYLRIFSNINEWSPRTNGWNSRCYCWLLAEQMWNKISFVNWNKVNYGFQHYLHFERVGSFACDWRECHLTATHLTAPLLGFISTWIWIFFFDYSDKLFTLFSHLLRNIWHYFENERH